MIQSSRMPTNLVTVFGGGGFIGRHVVKQLAEQGWRIRVASRKPHLASHLRPLGTPGQIALVQANIRDAASVDAAITDSDAVINLVGILAAKGSQTFDAIQNHGAALIAETAARHKIKTFVHMSAIGANTDSPSAYGKSKAQGERAVLKAIPEAIILRPSLVFGAEDSLFNRFAAMSRLSPVLPYVPGNKGLLFPFMSNEGHKKACETETLFQPVYVGDVAKAVLSALKDDACKGKIFELGGPEQLSFRELLIRMLNEIGRNKLMMPLGLGLAKTAATILQYAPGAPLTPDQVLMLSEHNIVSETAKAENRTLKALGIHACDLGAVLPLYLRQYRRAGEFTRIKRSSNEH